MKNNYTVKQISDLLNVSKPTVQKTINEKQIPVDHIEKNKYRYYNLEQTTAIIKEIDPDFDFAKLSKITEKPQNQPKNTENSIEKPPENRQTTEKLLEMLQAEIEKKDRELERKDQQIDSLQNKLDKAYEQITDLATKAQYITAADKTTQLIEQQQQQKEVNTEAAAAEEQDEKAVEQKKKKHWFDIFRK